LENTEEPLYADGQFPTDIVYCHVKTVPAVTFEPLLHRICFNLEDVSTQSIAKYGERTGTKQVENVLFGYTGEYMNGNVKDVSKGHLNFGRVAQSLPGDSGGPWYGEQEGTLYGVHKGKLNIIFGEEVSEDYNVASTSFFDEMARTLEDWELVNEM
jgi:hypothetical protein